MTDIPPLTNDNIEDRAAWAREHTVTDWIPHQTLRQDRPDGTIILRAAQTMGEVAPNTGHWLHHWAGQTPNHVALAERVGMAEEGTPWRRVTYAELLTHVRAVASSLLTRQLGEGDTIAVLSGNSIDHLILSLAAQYIGVPVVPLAEQYSLIPEAHGRLTFVLDKVHPKLAFVDDAGRYASALQLPELAGVEVVASRIAGTPRDVTAFASMLSTPEHPDLDTAHARIGPETLAKILFTSGSSSEPKGVLTTHGMMCANQAQMSAVMPYLSARPPEVTDWLPWNHVFGGSHNVNMMLAHGGTLTIDQGKPTARGFPATQANRRERPGSLSFNVPVGFAMLTDAAEADPAMRKALFRNLELIFYAGASLPQEVWLRLERFCLEERGGLPMMASSWGLTETAPACVMVHEPIGRSGVIGVPLPEVEVKLIPDEDMRCEIRVRGPNITRGYFADPEKTAAAFDEEGFFITGDAVRFVNPDDPSRGLIFDGRVSEDFKLNTGTWVQAGTLRMNVLDRLKGQVQDVVICGHDRGEIGLFIFPLAGKSAKANQSQGALVEPHLAARVESAMRDMNEGATGSAKRITRAMILADPPSLADHEITDKGSLNIKKILTRRADLLERLYDNEDPALIRV